MSSGRVRSLIEPDAERTPIALAALDGAMRSAGSDIRSALQWCVRVGRSLPPLGEGDTAAIWDVLAETAYRDVSAARILEPHLDAIGILRQAGTDLAAGRDPWLLSSVDVDQDSSWGVFAAEGPGTRLEASETSDGWLLTGTKPWCSLAADLSHALVTAFDGDERRLFAVPLRAAEVHPHDGPWVARGLAEIVSAPVDFSGARAVPVGEKGWYLDRDGFAWGGMSVAVCWWGGALGVRDALLASASAERADQVALVHVGRADAALWAARAALREAAELIDRRAGMDGKILAERVRGAVADAVTTTLAEADAALGPGPLVTDDSYARRVADLHLYLRQHHGLRDAARLGRLVVAAEPMA